ncbi:hypothetical protein M3A96_00730 [Helcobacillus massiliensis]|uniref:DUF6541 family protein n=1 Tax=Helcobacillus massiliensis TaxID=521392 RepID=UPI0021A5239E|nr:DUF6541 family protein [Helcobacillus massiliensis]MCT1556654.1 hypothetical protein [Helcobacillus massiliensis]MCT2035848.1 hypothetical protein [Helcobacillus massiliensis]MCT2331070.1 hypothetical protein [Helcobacillus massiliensis]
MDYLYLFASALTAIAVLFLPGSAVTWQLPLSWTSRTALAAPVSVVIVFVAAESAARLGVSWSPLPVLAVTLLFVAVTALAMLPVRLRRRRASERAVQDADGGHRASSRSRGATRVLRRHDPAVPVALAIAAVVTTWTFCLLMGTPVEISQTYDNIFHMNAIRWIENTGSASAWNVGSLTIKDHPPSYYPSAWHQIASLPVILFNAPIWLAQNALMFVVSGIVWPLGLLAISKDVLGLRRVGVLATGMVAGMFMAFPYGPGMFGILLPFLLAMTLMPALVAIVALTVRINVGADVHPLTAVPLAGLSAAAVAVAHPQGVHAGFLLLVPMIAWATVHHLIGRRWAWAALCAAALAAAVPAAWWVWSNLRPSAASASIWIAHSTEIQALRQVLAMGIPSVRQEILLVAVTLTSLVIVLVAKRGRFSFLALSFLASGWVFYVALAVNEQPLRYDVTGPFYSDQWRMAAIPLVVGLPAIGLAAEVIAQKWASPRIVLIGLVAVGGLSSMSWASEWVTEFAHEQWRPGPLVSDDEKVLLRSLPDYVPEDAVIATNALNGSSLAYAIGDRQVLNYTVSFSAPREQHLLNAKLDDAQEDPKVCDAMHDLGVDYALDFGPEEIGEGSATYTGLNEISETGAAEVVHQVGDAKLLRMKPCRGTDGRVR